MKKFFVAVFSFCCLFASAQVASNIRPDANGAKGVFSEWKKVDVSFDDGGTAVIEYRIALATRKGIACYYEVEVKNNSDLKLKVRVKSTYSDKLVKGQYSDEAKETIKGGKTMKFDFIAQGCKNDQKLEGDFAICMACSYGVSIYVSK